MDFEERLNELVDEAREAGVTVEQITSAFELKTMALEESEDHEANES